MSAALDTTLELVAGGVAYTGWETIEIERGIDACASHFNVTCPERFLGNGLPVPLAPFTPVQLRLKGQIILTGYVFAYDAQFSPGQRRASISGRSLTAQLVDCSPDIPAGQYQGYSLAAIANSLCQLFGLKAKIQTNLASAALADATLERAETAFRFIDRLATICGVLAFDDESGALVLANAGASRASGTFIEGGNIVSARLQNDCAERYSTYIVKGQSGICAAAGASGFPSGAGAAGAADDASPSLVTPPTGAVQTQQRAVANDPGVPLYRPKIIIAEGQLDQAQLQLRANWQRAYAYGKSLAATFTVPGWTQPDGGFWRINEMATANSPTLGIDEDLLILKTAFRYSGRDGYLTEITIGPVEGAIPSPSLLRQRRRKRGRHARGKGGFDFSALGVAKA